MKMFTSARDAKEFLVSRIVSEAELEGVRLSETERKELYLSESASTLPDMERINDEFEWSYDQEDYERKVAALIRKARKRDRRASPEDDKRWSEAIAVLDKEDHYILVMVKQAGISTRPPGDFLKLFAAGFVVVSLLMCASWLLAYLQIDVSRDAFRFYIWVAMVSAIAIYILLSVVLGRARVDDFVGGIVQRVFIRFVGPK
jgi:hypothetical protein